uniref:Uncharacterized protein LOC104226787 isoform X2 n=1 Tax=Nicotiana sylvestris TaxID=4096 RepID=A0A1U7WR63_NICSY|nr:PREDICTED: uncharacterized protein LOC104226787 isoform X2 [Nicotiana sylvestris]
MACGTLRSIFLTEPWRPLSRKSTGAFFHTQKCFKTNLISCGCKLINYKRSQYLKCSNNKSPLASEGGPDQGPPQEAVLKAISVSKSEGRVGQTTNVIIGGTVQDDATNEWLALDKKVNSYPTERGFTAIGTGGDDFVQAMVVAVESVIQQPISETKAWYLNEKSREDPLSPSSKSCTTSLGDFSVIKKNISVSNS